MALEQPGAVSADLRARRCRPRSWLAGIGAAVVLLWRRPLAGAGHWPRARAAAAAARRLDGGADRPGRLYDAPRRLVALERGDPVFAATGPARWRDAAATRTRPSPRPGPLPRRPGPSSRGHPRRGAVHGDPAHRGDRPAQPRRDARAGAPSRRSCATRWRAGRSRRDRRRDARRPGPPPVSTFSTRRRARGLRHRHDADAAEQVVSTCAGTHRPQSLDDLRQVIAAPVRRWSFTDRAPGRP